MNGVPGMPEKVFALGNVRVALWPSPIAATEDGRTSRYKVTVERKDFNIRGYPEYTGVLEPEDIPKAILVLKEAHNYLANPNIASQQVAEFEDANLRLVERVP